MCLTEPHCGTDLGQMKTKAVPNGDGSYSVDGTKIFISAGEHDLTENIVHIVLAKLPDAPKGTKGLSLFIIPKFLPAADGSAVSESRSPWCRVLAHLAPGPISAKLVGSLRAIRCFPPAIAAFPEATHTALKRRAT